MAEPVSDGLERILNGVQGCYLNANVCDKIMKALDYENTAKPQLIEKLLEMCIQDPKDNEKYAVETLNIVSLIIRKVTAGEFSSKPDLLPSMLEILHMIKTSVYSCTSHKIKVLYFKILISYPNEVFLQLEDYNELLELFNLYSHHRIPHEIRVQPINVLHKYLKVLPPDKRSKFVEQGICIWLLRLVPSVMLFVTIPDFEIETSLATLEMVANELLYIDYHDNHDWQSVLQCIYEPQKYPRIMKDLLTKGSNIWHRLWIIFIKMLKDQLTKSGSSGSPINSMLPVVEMAFKMDITNRCRAFDCWNVLIDNFSTETNEAYVNKRIKLLVIPLYSNNAKAEDAVIAKIHTWWHLISSYSSKLNNFDEIILIPFLHFCFGKIITSKPINVPGLLTIKTKEHCLEAFVNILGHHNCDGCVSLLPLKDKVMNVKFLVASRKLLFYCLSTAIKIVSNNSSKLRDPFKCAWICLIKLICEVPDNDLRRDIFIELMDMLKNLIQDCDTDTLADIVFKDLILILFEKDDHIIKLLNTVDDPSSPLHNVLSIIMNPLFNRICERYDMSKAVENVKPFADFIVMHCFHTSIVEDILNQLLANYKSLVLWTAITSSLCEQKCSTNATMLCEMLLWPLKHMDLFTEVEYSTSVWLALFNFIQAEVATSSITDKILEILSVSGNINEVNSSFFLNISVILLSQKITADKEIKYDKEVQLVQNVISKIDDLDYSRPVFSKLLEVLLEVFRNLLQNVNLDIAKHALTILKCVFGLLSESKKPTEVDAAFLVKVEQILKLADDLFKLQAYASLKEIVLNKFIKFAHCYGQQQMLKDTVLSTLQMLLNSMDSDNLFVITITNTIDCLKECSHSTNDKPQFTTPTTKKAKKKETSIVNRVVENGEEFVVVKSNWKFNPNKLTDNQKEKLQRKREDIPALYQDLSQSQDEIKLCTWKNESQDTLTTTTSSKSNDLRCESVSSILKNMPNTDVVPKILKNILTESNEKSTLSMKSKNDNIIQPQTPIIKGVRSRLALKDRVLRNVKNLMEKSNVENGEEHAISLIADVPPRSQTPTGMSIKMTETVLNSAPSEINSERPSRVKRKPKKFEEMQVFAIKKRRQSLGNGESQNKESFEDFSPDITDNSDAVETVLNSSDTVKVNKIIQGTVLVENELQYDVNVDALSKNNGHEILVQDENVNDQEYSKSNADKETSRNDIDIHNNDNLIIDITDKNQSINDQLGPKEDNSSQNPINKKTGKRKSRIEKELAIDMVEGHPFLKVQSEKRLTRKKASESPALSRRKSLTQKLNKSKIDLNNTPKADKKVKEIDRILDKTKELPSISSSQESSFQEENVSQDIIESSQDSTISITSVKSFKPIKRVPVVTLENIECVAYPDKTNKSEKSLGLDRKKVDDLTVTSCENKDDSDFPFNKTAVEHVLIDLTDNLDTEPIGNISSDEVIVIADKEEPSIVINLGDTYVDMDTQDIADADTQPVDPKSVTNLDIETTTIANETKMLDAEKNQKHAVDSNSNLDTLTIPTQEESTISLTESIICETETKHDESSTKPLQKDEDQRNQDESSTKPSQKDEDQRKQDESLTKLSQKDEDQRKQDESLTKPSQKDEDQRKQDFLNNTLEISPIKTLSPVREKKSPSPETSSDYVVIKLSSPVQSNGEPYEKCDSPEIFTEDKVSPDRRDQSPPREETRVSTVSPRSLSLKKNKPQVRSGGRAAQMLGLCVPVPNRLQTILNSEKTVESEEPKKCSSLNSSARRNLRILYNSTNESNETMEENEESQNFLTMKRSLPAVGSSPSVPILKRKLADIVDDTTVSPASKRKRVSFHDPPVSTTICVKKYIEPSAARSPQNSSTKRQERQLRSQVCVNLKSLKRLDTVFKLDTALTKAVESFSEGDVTPSATEDTEMSSLEPTPQVEIVKNSEFNNVDPISVDLINCMDPVDNIAGDLSSPAMRPLLVKEFAGKIETVGDLAKLTELEVNRLCIKAPKVQVAKKVLTEYAKKINTIANEITPMTEAAFSESTVVESKVADVEMQTDCVDINSMEVQTESSVMSMASTQTDTVSTVDCDIQTEETGNRSSRDIAISLLQKPDFCEHLNELLDVPSKQSIATSLPLSVLTDAFPKEISFKESSDIIDRLLEKHTCDSINGRNDNLRLSFMQDYLSKCFSSKDLILLCSNLLKKVHQDSI